MVFQNALQERHGARLHYQIGWLTTYAKGLPNSVCPINECGPIHPLTFLYCAGNLGDTVISLTKLMSHTSVWHLIEDYGRGEFLAVQGHSRKNRAPS